MRNTIALMSARWIAIAVMVAFCTRGMAADPRLIEAAEKEGQLTVYGCDVSETPMQVKRFSELYPKIKVLTYVAGCWQIYNRHVHEKAAGKPLADIFYATEDVLSKLDDDHETAAYESPELANFPATARPRGSLYSLYKVILAGFATNTDVIDSKTAPQDWLDFVAPSPSWKSKISFYDPRTSSAAFTVLASLEQNFGDQKAGDIYAGLKQADAELAPTTPVGVARLVSGEKPIMFYILTNQFGVMKAKGAPMEFIVPKSGAISMGFGVSLASSAEHPNAARLFVDYILSEGQNVVHARGEYGLRNGLAAPAGLPELGDIKIMPTDVKRALADQKKLLTWWQSTSGIQ